ncbi:F0F1 ATP synthase subunit B family protein [Dongia sedimenti]|uniref:ATP synthase subunit b n=1 Tax=Dongia sedimenti TaxID=3064282 RepID=A0ABU0YGX0_9PROT|nr:F0F1 ATP synthase subunit B' [Rhodospirillaceae bacterium R-7]
MPQFDPTFWAPQLFWLVIVTTVLFLVMWKVTLPRVDAVITDRQDRIAGNLQKAETLKGEAESALAAYQKSIADARAAAQAEHAKAAAAIAAESAKREAVFGKRLGDEEAAAEANIAAARSAAMAQVKPIAIDLAQTITEKLVGTKVGADAASSAVEAAAKERA